MGLITSFKVQLGRSDTVLYLAFDSVPSDRHQLRAEASFKRDIVAQRGTGESHGRRV